MFNESTLVLEGVTLGEMVELMVEVLVDLSGGAVLDEKTAENTEAAHPDDLAVRDIISMRSNAEFPPQLLDGFFPIAFAMALRWPTLAYERPRYPSSYRNHGGGQFVGRRSGLGHGHASAW